MEANTGSSGVVIGIGNQKGGVAKTTTTVHLAAALGERGNRVLIIDCDSNHGATSSVGVEGSGWRGTFDVLLGEEDPLDVVLMSTEEDVQLPANVDLIPATRELERLETALKERLGKFARLDECFARPLQILRPHYDYIFLDTGPNAGTATLSAYAAADGFILCAMPEPMAVENLGDALRDIQDAQKNCNPRLQLIGVVLTAANKRTLSARRLTSFVDEIFEADENSAKFRTVFSRTTRIPEVQEVGRTLFELFPNHKVTDEFRQLADELEERLETVLPGQARKPNIEIVHG